MIQSTTTAALGLPTIPKKDRIPLNRLRVEKEIPEKVRPPIPHIAAKRMPLIIEAETIHQLQKKLQTGNVVDRSREKERKLLHEQSKQRVQNWQNTIVGQRRQRLKDREIRLQIEEEERVKIDQAHARDEQERRNQFIQRAKNLIFYEQDKVKKIHSNVLLDLVLQERDIQIQYKKERQERLKVNQDDWKKISDANWEKKARAEEQAKEDAEKKRYAIAAEQHRQHEKKKAQEAEELRKKMEEGQHVRQLDHEYNSKEDEREAKRRLNQKQLMADLNMMRDRAREGKQIATKEEQEQDVKIKEWFDKKENLEKMRKEAEERLFKEHLKIREKIGQDQYMLLESERNKKSEWVDMRTKQKQKEDQKKEEKLALKKKAASEEMQSFFQEMQARKQEEQQKRQELNARVAEENAQTRQLIAEEAVSKRENIRKKELELYSSHKRQIELATSKREETRRQIVADKDAVKKDEQQESQVLRNYISGIVQEPWMKHNPRAHTVDEYHKKAYEQNLFSMGSPSKKKEEKKA